jgi:small subunit ribosomal protein S20
MANRKSKIKTIETNEIRRERNKAFKTRLSSQVRKLSDVIKLGDKEKAEAELKASLVRIDKSVSKGILHANTAARTKSRLNRRVKAMA